MRKKSGQKLEYNPSQRNPQFASAEKTSMWELHTLTRHFHPSVKVHAENILNKETETASKSGDPLEDHTLIKSDFLILIFTYYFFFILDS